MKPSLILGVDLARIMVHLYMNEDVTDEQRNILDTLSGRIDTERTPGFDQLYEDEWLRARDELHEAETP